MTGRPVPSTTDAPPADAVPARPASTVLIVRDGAEGVEVFMMRRQLTMAFAAGALVFPGGGVDPQDADSSLPWHGPSPAELGRAMGLPAARAREHVCAAVRDRKSTRLNSSHMAITYGVSRVKKNTGSNVAK